MPCFFERYCLFVHNEHRVLKIKLIEWEHVFVHTDILMYVFDLVEAAR